VSLPDPGQVLGMDQQRHGSQKEQKEFTHDRRSSCGKLIK
jgi:hypothetical protein